MSKPIPVNTPLLNGNEEKYLLECIRTGWISSEGPFVSEFEDKFSSYIGRDFGVSCANGSAALDIAVAALEIGPGDEVIMPTFTIISPALSVVRAGAVPVFVDSDAETWNMDVSQVETKITDKTKAIIVVHIYGLPVDMDPILELCERYGLHLIEDAAEAHGQAYHTRKCGSFGNISTFSFYPNKLVTTGEGGMILTDDQELAERCRKLRNLAFEPDAPRFIHREMGWNYRMTNLQAAVGLAQLERLSEFIVIKQNIGEQYQNSLQDLKDFELPVQKTKYSKNHYWVFGLVAKKEELKNNILATLANYQIGTRPFFWCMHEQPVFKQMHWFRKESFPVAERLARHGFYLPSGLGIDDGEIRVVCSIIKKYCA